MAKTKKNKLSANNTSTSETILDNSAAMDNTELLSSKKKKKSKKGDTSMQSTLNSFISSSTSKQQIKIKSSPSAVPKTLLSPKKERLVAPTNDSTSEELLDNNKKRKSNDATGGKTSKKMRLDSKKAVRNGQSNRHPENQSDSEEDSCLPVKSNTTSSPEKKGAGKSKSKKKQQYSNVSSDEGLDSGEDDEEDQMEEQQQQTELDEGTEWTKEQTEELIFMIKEKISVVKPEDTMSYRCRMKILNWGTLPSELHPPRTEQECMEQLHHIVENTKTVRNLSEMLRAYRTKAPRRKAPVLVPIRRFMLEHGDKIKKLKGNWIVNARNAFAELPEKERAQYIDAYNKELAENKSQKVKLGRSAFKIFCEDLPDDTLEEQKKKFQTLTNEQRLPLIKLALKEYKKTLEAFESQHGHRGDLKPKPPTNRISKEEWKIFLESKGMPLLRAASPYQLFLLDQDGTEGGVKSSLQRYREFLRCSQSRQYEHKFKQEMDEFVQKFKAWFESVKSELWKEPAHAYYTEVTTAKGGLKKNKALSKVTTKVMELEESYVESTMVGKFADEPVPGPLVPKDVFKHFAKARNSRITKNQLNTAWNQMPKMHREKFTEVAGKNIKEYKNNLKKYVKDLSEHERKVYIGQNRVRFIRIFEGTDIFESNYPCSEYPPFRIPSKVEKKSPQETQLDLDMSAMFKSSFTANGMEGEEDEEEEEGSESEEEELPNKQGMLSEDSFQEQLPSTSTPGAIRTGTLAGKQSNNIQGGSDSDSTDSEGANGGGNNSTRYLETGHKVHSKKLLVTQNESESDDDSDSAEEESPKPPTQTTKAGRSPAQAAASFAPPSNSEDESSSSDEDAPVHNSHSKSNKSSPHVLLPTKKHTSFTSKAATPSSRSLKQSPKEAAKSSSSDSSDSEEESPKKRLIAQSSSAGGKKKKKKGNKQPPPPPKDESSSDDDDDIESAWA